MNLSPFVPRRISPEHAENDLPPLSSVVRVHYPQDQPLISYFLMGFCLLVFLAQMASETLLGADLPALLGMKISEAIINGQIWRFFTPVFLHGSLLHLGFNLYALYVFGPSLEARFGRGRFLVLFLLSGFVGNVISFIFSPSPSLGSSTAIFGLLGAEMIFFYRNRALLGSDARRLLINVLTVAGINLLIGLSPGIDNWGHIGGLIGGSLFSWFGGPLLAVEGVYPELNLTDRRHLSTTVLAALGVGGFFLALAAVWMILRSGGL
ncbi:MAG: rhomboid family intramembrane serine protease [Anaerolineales bacterium]|nr:rhomboid family intramembrane serine protease [Anaerolineales bacterium]MDW8162838.1 rhomboid family intramembrane serine protease [Anaerolineales bacterium]